MSVDELIEKLKELSEAGHGDLNVWRSHPELREVRVQGAVVCNRQNKFEPKIVKVD